MNKNIFPLALIVLLLAFLPGNAWADEVGAPDELNMLIETALVQSPALQAILDQQEGAGHRVESADDLADPVVSFAFSNYPVDSFAADETPMTGNELQLAQMIPYPGKLKAKKDVALQDELWFKGVYEDARLELARQIKDAYYELYAIDRAIETVRSNVGLLDDLSQLADL